MLRAVVWTILFRVMSFAQTPVAQSNGLQFEVVSIKSVPREAPSPTTRVGFNVTGDRVQIRNYRLLSLLTTAFRVQDSQVDGPNFLRDEFFDMQAKLPAGATPEQVPEMLQKMLAERFKLTYHRETRNYQMNVLTVGKNGMKLPRLPDDSRLSPTANRLPDGTTQRTQTGKVASLFTVMNSFGGLQLVDETGLDGIYSWVSYHPPRTPYISYQDALQESFRAMIQAAGLKMETRNAPKDTIIVDHLEKKPTEN